MNNWIRQTHRWLSIAFTVTVIANFVALAQSGGLGNQVPLAHDTSDDERQVSV